MEHDNPAQRQTVAIRQLREHEHRDDANRIVESLDRGLAVLAELLYTRVHEDVENTQGVDSMLAPIAPAKTKALTIREIEFYQIAESAVLAWRSGYVREDDRWYAHWLSRLRLGESSPQEAESARVADYLSLPADKRRLAFTDVLNHVVPESRRAPLVLFQLVPLAVQIATALAFGDNAQAAALRSLQVDHLPAIADCRECKRRLLANGEHCSHCGNPLWGSSWLTSAE
jgi:hypothetical protein